jgi:hypothetical protein
VVGVGRILFDDPAVGVDKPEGDVGAQQAGTWPEPVGEGRGSSRWSAPLRARAAASHFPRCLGRPTWVVTPRYVTRIEPTDGELVR